MTRSAKCKRLDRTLPKNDKIKIFDITVASNPNGGVTPLQPLDDYFKENEPLQLL